MVEQDDVARIQRQTRGRQAEQGGSCGGPSEGFKHVPDGTARNPPSVWHSIAGAQMQAAIGSGVHLYRQDLGQQREYGFGAVGIEDA